MSGGVAEMALAATGLGLSVTRIRGLAAAYRRQRNTAAERGIAWTFTMSSWLAVWVASGELEKRGRLRGNYVMARFGDAGPYSIDNVEIIPFERNCSDCRRNHPVSTERLRAQLIGKGRGWTKVRGKYQVTVSRKYVGKFASVGEAEVAYADAVAQMLLHGSFTRAKSPENTGARP